MVLTIAPPSDRNRFLQDLKVLAHPPEGRGIADPAIETGRVTQVSKHQSDRADGNLFTRSDHFAGEEIAEDLQRGHIGRGGGLVAPGGALKLKGLIRLGGVDQVESRAEEKHAAVLGAIQMMSRGYLIWTIHLYPQPKRPSR